MLREPLAESHFFMRTTKPGVCLARRVLGTLSVLCARGLLERDLRVHIAEAVVTPRMERSKGETKPSFHPSGPPGRLREEGFVKGAYKLHLTGTASGRVPEGPCLHDSPSLKAKFEQSPWPR